MTIFPSSSSCWRPLCGRQSPFGGMSESARRRCGRGLQRPRLAQFYGGVENILKRLCRFHAVALPSGETWHVDLFQRFCPPGALRLPALFDDGLADVFSGYRKFCHVVHHGYGFQLDWGRIREGVAGMEKALALFRERLESHLGSL